MKKLALLLGLLSLTCTLLLASCTIIPQNPGGLTSQDTTQPQQQGTTSQTEQNTTASDTEADTEADTETNTDGEETTYGPLHFPESDAQ